MLIWSALFVVLSLGGAIAGDALGTIGGTPGGLVGAIDGTALSSWIGALLFWWELRAELRYFRKLHGPDQDLTGGPLASSSSSRLPFGRITAARSVLICRVGSRQANQGT